jgi:hypothetical protein
MSKPLSAYILYYEKYEHTENMEHHHNDVKQQVLQFEWSNVFVLKIIHAKKKLIGGVQRYDSSSK